MTSEGSNRGLIERGRRVLRIEREAIAFIESRLDETFGQAVRALLECSGKVILTGVGKSGVIAQKITATLNSTGTPAFYLHPIDALHGDLGMIQPGDAVIILSKSGNSDELSHLTAALTALRVTIVALTAPGSPLASVADIVLDCSIEREACPFDLAPTASTTAMLALGDALAVVLYEEKGFTREDFALTHPGGAIGRRLTLTLKELMKQKEDIPTVTPDAGFKEVILEMSRKRLGATLVVRQERLVGIITDGDLRRLLEREADLKQMTAEQMMTPEPMTAPPDTLGSVALAALEENKRTQLPVVESEGRLVGIVHLHDLIEAGLRP